MASVKAAVVSVETETSGCHRGGLQVSSLQILHPRQVKHFNLVVIWSMCQKSVMEGARETSVFLHTSSPSPNFYHHTLRTSLCWCPASPPRDSVSQLPQLRQCILIMVYSYQLKCHSEFLFFSFKYLTHQKKTPMSG